MAREEFTKSCKLMDQIRATVTAIILIWSRGTIFMFTLTAYLWIISRSKILLELMISTKKLTWHAQNFLATLERFGRTSQCEVTFSPCRRNCASWNILREFWVIVISVLAIDNYSAQIDKILVIISWKKIDIDVPEFVQPNPENILKIRYKICPKFSKHLWKIRIFLIT